MVSSERRFGNASPAGNDARPQANDRPLSEAVRLQLPGLIFAGSSQYPNEPAAGRGND